MKPLLKKWRLRMVQYRQEADNANSPITRVKSMNKFFILRDCIKEIEEQCDISDVVHSSGLINNNGVVIGAAAMFAVYTLFLLTFVIYILKNHEIIPL